MDNRPPWLLISATVILLASLTIYYLVRSDVALSTRGPLGNVNFWVAIGTISLAVFTAALAGVTMASVRGTRDIMRAEDIRHQEQYAPFVSLEFVTDYEKMGQWSLVRGFQLFSKGLGPAIVSGYQVTGTYFRPEFSKEPDAYKLERGAELTLDLNVSEISWFVAVNQSFEVPVKEFEYEQGRAPGGVPDKYISFGTIVIHYDDVFGNAYQTVYERFGRGSYRWVKPKIRARKVAN